MEESFATVLEVIADLRADRPAVSSGNRTRTWAELDQRASRLAGHLAGRGIGRDARVAVRPRDLVVVDEVRRSPSGKADLRWAAEVARTARPR